MAINIAFNSFSLQTANILTADPIQADQMPDREFSSAARVRQDGAILTYAAFRDKTITLTGKVIGTSQTDLDQRLDAIKLQLAAFEANLDIDYNGGSRRYVATCDGSNTTFTRISVLAATFTMTFICSSAYGTDTSATTVVSATAVTTSPKSITTSVFGGTAPYQLPTISYTLTSFTGATSNTITFANSTTGQSISISRTWAAADVVVVNTLTKSVTVNGTAVDYQGVFPWFAPGVAGTFVVSDDMTVRSGSVTMTNTNRFL